jgi:hypothetical protein
VLIAFRFDAGLNSSAAKLNLVVMVFTSELIALITYEGMVIS